MKHLKVFRLVVLAGTALLALASSASATTLTSPAGTSYTGPIKAAAIEGGLYIYTNGQLSKTCNAELEWKVESHGPAVTAKGTVASFVLPECGSGLTLLKPGAIEIHTLKPEENTGAGTVTWTGAQITTTSLGDCTYELEKPYFANLTGSKLLTGKTAIIDFEARWRSLFCAPTEWKAYFRVSSPDYLDVD
jgi:hypothetical protein